MNAILLALLSFTYLAKFYPGYSALIVAAVALFAAIEFNVWRLNEKNRNLARYALVTLVVFFVVVAPALLEVFLRHISAPYEHIHDGALQTEAAMQFLLSGQIPFGQNYAETMVGKWPHYVIDPAVNPTLHHYLYLPVTFLLPIPFSLLSQSMSGWFDVRIVTLVAFGVTWLILSQLTPAWESKLGLLIVFGLNPLFAIFFIEGRNDILVLMWLAAILLALKCERHGLSAIFFALACATKATAWLIAPFYFAHLWFSSKNRAEERPKRAESKSVFWRGAAVFVAAFAGVMFPFLVWNFRAVVEDTLILGSSANYIWGYGISMILLALGVIQDRLGAFPFWFLQLTFGLPTILLLWRHQFRTSRDGAHAAAVRAFAIASAVFSFVFFFFSRHLADSYLGYALSVGLIGYFLPNGKEDQPPGANLTC